MKRTALPVLATIALIACTDTSPTRPARPKLSAETLDGAHGGNAHFFFLPPLVAQPSFSGVSNPFLAPDVQICPLLPPINTICDPTAPTITLTAAMPKGNGEEYHVDWNSDRSTVGKTYRITVQVKQDELGLEHRLGYTDAQPNGRTLSIRFRIERGALCEAGFGCARFTVTQAGGTFVTTDLDAGAMFPAGALPPGVNSVQLTIERIPHTAFAPTTGPLPTALHQFPFFFDFSSDPNVMFVKPVLLGVCELENPEDPYFPNVPHDQLVLGHPTHVGPGTVEFLPREEAPFIVEGCPGTGTGGIGGIKGARPWIARGGLPWLLERLFLPQQLHAASLVGHGGLGGSLLGPLSSPVNAVLVEMRNNSAGSQNALAGSSCNAETFCKPPSVIIRDFGGVAAAGVPVTFRVTAGGGTISGGGRSGTSITVNTDEGGIASLDSWTLGTTPGVNTVSATAGVSGSPVTFFVTTTSGGEL